MAIKLLLLLIFILNKRNMLSVAESGQESDEAFQTVNSDSFFEVMSKQVPEIASKVDQLLMESKMNVFKNQNCGLNTQDLFFILTSKVLKLENEIEGAKSCFYGSKLEELRGPSGNVASDLHSKIASLQDSLSKEALKRQELEERLNRMGGKYVDPEAESQPGFSSVSAYTKVHSTCDAEGINEILGHQSLLMHLSRINFDIFLRKPTNASSIYTINNNHKVLYAVDGDFTAYFLNAKESNPWLIVDLEVPHLIWEIKITVRETTRTSGIKIYLANNVTFDSYGAPVLTPLPLFGSQVGDSFSTTVIFPYAGGMCGRYIAISREVINEYLIIREIQGVGYALN